MAPTRYLTKPAPDTAKRQCPLSQDCPGLWRFAKEALRKHRGLIQSFDSRRVTWLGRGRVVQSRFLGSHAGSAGASHPASAPAITQPAVAAPKPVQQLHHQQPDASWLASHHITSTDTTRTVTLHPTARLYTESSPNPTPPIVSESTRRLPKPSRWARFCRCPSWQCPA